MSVWNKFTAHFGSLFHENRREPSALRPSASLSTLHHKNLMVVRPSKSQENLCKVDLASTQSPKQAKWRKISSAKHFFMRKNDRKTTVPCPSSVSFAEAQSRPTIQASSEFYPLTLSASWHSNLASSCVLQIPAGQVRQQAYPENDRHRLSTAEKYSRPKRARSISSQTRVQVAPRSTTPGFRTPQSMMSTRDRTILDAQFLAMNVSNVDVPLTNNDFMFKRLETIGSGSYATVYKTQNRVNGQVFALKEIKLQPQEGLPFTAIREVSLLRGLRHANIVRLYQIVHQPHALVLIFEYMKTDLSKYMENYKNGLECLQTKVFMFQLLRGLAYCHERKILHRDLKPQNLLVSEEGELKLADFGLARAQSVPSKTFSHDVVTLWYRPPDVLLGSTQYSTSLDMWGVGCIFAEMVTGLALFSGGNNVVDQLDRIFSIRGVPSETGWTEAMTMPKYSQYRFAPYSELAWDLVDSQLGNIDNDGSQLLTLFLKLNPKDRISAVDAMKHNYFSPLPLAIHNLDPCQSVLPFIYPNMV